MSSTDKLPTTQRAYTLRIADYVVEPATPNTATNWRSRIWHTHLATNRGTAAFGEWLLTLRGGLDHRLADLPPLTQDQAAAELELLTKAAKNDNRPVPAAEDARMSAEEKRHGQIGERRVLLAMSWLVVEVGYQGSFALVPDQVVPAFRGILKGRGMGEREMDDWVRDCASSLSAAIKPGATWVNRSAAFDAALLQLGPTLNRDEIWDLMLRFFGSQDAYLEPVALEEDEGAPATEEKAKDLVQKAGQWLSSRFGTGRGADFTKMGKVYSEMATWAATVQAPLSSSDFFGQLAAALKVSATGNDTADAILALISGPGYKSATRNLILKFGGQAMIFEADVAKLVEAAGQDEQIAGGKVGGKGHREWSDRLLAGVEQICGFTYLGQEPSAGEETDDNEPAKRGAARHGEFSVMLDHAARRVSLVHSWAKRAEAERRQFTAAAAKLTPLRQTHPSGVAFLDAFCAQRSISTFAEDAYRIRPRAVQGWKQVVAVWRQPDCHTVEERIASARAAQDSDEIDKFGDIQLFEAMAEEDARCVWGAGAELLLDYAAATDADHKRERFKVPAYCHPHPLRHPVFCDFGNSRWEVKFACHAARMRRKDKSGRPEGPTCLERAKAKLDARKGEMARAETKLAQFRNETERKERLVRLEEARQSLSEAQAELGWLESPRALSLTLLNGTTPEPTLLRWQSKRLSADLAFGQSGGGAETPPIEVSRATRHARAAARTLPDAPVKILQLFDDESWNCRLQAPRQQLDRLAAYLDKHNLSMDAEATWDEAARRQRDHIEWLGTFSAKLTLQGPWTDYCNSLKDQTPFRRKNQSIKADAARQVSMKVWSHGELNNSRGGRAKLTLSRLPGLRVLSVDLGHRYGAACAVWETMTGGQLAALCQETGTPPPGGDTVCHTVRKETNGKRRTIILRRLGPDTLDGQPHPAPWARLDRQFLVKLQGEESATRMASPAELAFVKDLELACGMAPERPPTPGGATAKPATVRGPSLDLDEVMSRAVDTLRHELKRHALRACLARDINALRPPGMGGKGRSTDLAGEDLKNCQRRNDITVKPPV